MRIKVDSLNLNQSGVGAAAAIIREQNNEPTEREVVACKRRGVRREGSGRRTLSFISVNNISYFISIEDFSKLKFLVKFFRKKKVRPLLVKLCNVTTELCFEVKLDKCYFFILYFSLFKAIKSSKTFFISFFSWMVSSNLLFTSSIFLNFNIINLLFTVSVLIFFHSDFNWS